MSARDPQVERIVLEELRARVWRETGSDCDWLIDRIRVRMREGARTYGDDAFTLPGRDNPLEHHDEMADGVAYLLFELHLLNQRADAPDGAHQLLFDGMVAAVTSYLKAAEYRRLTS